MAQLLHTPHVHFKAHTEGKDLILSNKNRPDQGPVDFLMPVEIQGLRLPVPFNKQQQLQYLEEWGMKAQIYQ